MRRAVQYAVVHLERYNAILYDADDALFSIATLDLR